MNQPTKPEYILDAWGNITNPPEGFEHLGWVHYKGHKGRAEPGQALLHGHMLGDPGLDHRDCESLFREIPYFQTEHDAAFAEAINKFDQFYGGDTRELLDGKWQIALWEAITGYKRKLLTRDIVGHFYEFKSKHEAAEGHPVKVADGQPAKICFFCRFAELFVGVIHGGPSVPKR